MNRAKIADFEVVDFSPKFHHLLQLNLSKYYHEKDLKYFLSL